MFRRSPAPRPQPANPLAATSDANYLSAQVQQLLAMVLPEPIVTVLAALSDLLYRAILGKPNEPATYTSTLVPPLLLLLVTYLSVMLAYRTVKSFFSFIIFSVKWFVILAALATVVAYSLGNGNLEQGARAAAERSGLDLRNSGSWYDALRRSPASQQVAPYLSQAGGIVGALPLLQSVSQQVVGIFQGNEETVPKDRNIREYRDVRPKKKRYSFGAEDHAGPSSNRMRQTSSSHHDETRRRASAPVWRDSSTPDSSTDTAMERIAKFMGAKF